MHKCRRYGPFGAYSDEKRDTIVVFHLIFRNSVYINLNIVNVTSVEVHAHFYMGSLATFMPPQYTIWTFVTEMSLRTTTTPK